MTLLEVLVALAIFIIIAAAGYTGVQQGIAVQDQLQQQQAYWRRLDSVMTLMEMDLELALGLAPRVPIQDAVAFRGQGDNSSAAQGEMMRFTRGSNQSFYNMTAGPYLRVSYRMQEGTLYRASRQGLNLPGEQQPEYAELIEDVSSVSLRYLQQDRRWVDNWPLRLIPGENSSVPRAVELTMHMADDITYRRVFHVGPPG